MIILNCPKCAKEFKFKDQNAGRKFTCTKCGNECRIPPLQELQKPSPIAVADSMPATVPPPPKRLRQVSAKPSEEPSEELSALTRNTVDPEPTPHSSDRVESPDPVTAASPVANKSDVSTIWRKLERNAIGAGLWIGLRVRVLALILATIGATLWVTGFFAKEKPESKDGELTANRKEAELAANQKEAELAAKQKEAELAAKQKEAELAAKQKEAELAAKQLSFASNAIKALGRLESAVKIGVNNVEYVRLTVDVKAEVDEAERSLPAGKIIDSITGSMKACGDAAELWSFKIRNAGHGISKEYGHEQLICTYKIPVNRLGVASCDVSMQIMWLNGSEHLAKARKLQQ